MPDRFTVVITSDRYGHETSGLEFEREMVAAIDDLEIDLRGAPSTSEEELIEAGREADALLVSTREAVTRDVLARLTRTRVISRYGVGLDNVDLDAATDYGIVVTHYPGYCTAEVADHALSLILALNRRIVVLDRKLRQGAWLEHGASTGTILGGPVPPLREQTLGIIGYGRIGRSVAERAKPFGMTLLIADPYVEAAVIEAAGAEAVSLNDLLKRADIVTVHCPLTPESRGMIGAAEIAQMKPGALLVNTARGPILDLEAVAAALQSGSLGGAGIDVFYPEPLPGASLLYSLPNVILTPHAAYYSERSVEIVRRETFNEALAVLRGKRPQTVANPGVLDKVSLAP